MTICSTLLVLAASAHAGTWSAPVFIVANRVPAPASNLNVGGGGGVNGGAVDDTGPEASGSITATFTWTASYTGEAAPEKVIVLQTSEAAWRARRRQNPLGRPGSGAQPQPTPTSSPAALLWNCDLTLASESMESTQAGGSADNGLGDAEVATLNGGTSSGTHAIVVSVGGTGGTATFTTPPVTLSATCDSEGAITSWGYGAQVIEPQITCNGQNITNPQPAYQAQAGQNTALAFAGVDANVIANPSWTLPDKRVKDWVHGDNASAEVPLTGADTASTSIPQVFWISGGEKTVTFHATVYGTAVTLTGKINVTRPTYNFSVIPQGTIQIYERANALWFSYGIYNPADDTDPSNGVKFSIPNNPANGTLSLAQVVTNTSNVIIDNNNQIHVLTPTSGLDAFPMRESDSPDTDLSAIKETSRSDSFDTWLMYRPDPTVVTGVEHTAWIYVPLKKLSWSWAGHAKRRGANWAPTSTVDANNVTSDIMSATPSQAATGTDTFDYPTWTQNIRSGHFVP